MKRVFNADKLTAPTWAAPAMFVYGRVGSTAAALFLWASATAFLMSTQFLFQPFVWRNFGLDDIAAGWLTVMRDRFVVALTLAAALTPALTLAPNNRRWRFAIYLVAIVIGAGAGEIILQRINPLADRQDAMSLIGRIARWTLVGGAIAALLTFWRSGSALSIMAAEAQIAEAKTRNLAASSQLEVLRRQIEPHFLFNTLATIRRLQETEPEGGQALLGRLFHYMSATLGGASDRRSTIGEEIALVRAYLDVCAFRMTGRLAVQTSVDDGLLDVPFPPLILATLAENAVKHGLFPNNGGTIWISAKRAGGEIEVALIDDGVGLSGEGGSGLGLANIAERLHLLYGPMARLRLSANQPQGVRATVRIPGASAAR